MKLLFAKKQGTDGIDYDAILTTSDRAGSLEVKVGEVIRTEIATPLGDLECWGFLPSDSVIQVTLPWSTEAFERKSLHEIKSELESRMFRALTAYEAPASIGLTA